MKIAALVAVTVLYGLLFHGFMRLSVIVFGPFEMNEAAVQWQGLAYVNVSAVLAAAGSTAIWIWRATSVSVAQAWGVGCLTITLIVVNQLVARGLDGLVASLSARPLHSFLTYLVVFVAVPVCVLVPLRVRRRSTSRIPGDAR